METPSGYDAVMTLNAEHPEWIPVVVAAVLEAQITPRFPGTRALRNIDASPLRNLRPLVRYGILRHEDSTRQNKRAYYTVPDLQGAQRALNAMGITAIASRRSPVGVASPP